MTRTTKEMIAVMQAFEDGKPIEFKVRDGQCWLPVSTNPKWNWYTFDYRIAVTKPSLDWSHVSREFNFLMRQSAYLNHNGALMNTRPYQGAAAWMREEGRSISADVFASYDPGTCDWQDSLVVRPGYVEADHD